MALVVPVALRILFGALAAAAIYISCAINIAALSAMFSGETLAFLPAVAVMTAAVKAGVPIWREWFRVQSRGLTAVFWLAILFDVICTIGLAAMQRDAARMSVDGNRLAVERLQRELEAVERDGASELRAMEALARHAREQSDFATVASSVAKYPGRAVTAIGVDLSAAKATAGDCEGRAHVDKCQRTSKLKGELADAVARETAANAVKETLASLETARKRLAQAERKARADRDVMREAPPKADKQSAAMAGVFGVIKDATGLGVPAAVQGAAFSALLMLLIELLAIFAPQAACAPLPPPPAKAVDAAPTLSPTLSPATPSTVGAWIEAAPADATGWIRTSTREISICAGVGLSAVHTELHKLAATRVIELKTSKSGTRIRRVTN